MELSSFATCNDSLHHHKPGFSVVRPSQPNSDQVASLLEAVHLGDLLPMAHIVHVSITDICHKEAVTRTDIVRDVESASEARGDLHVLTLYEQR